MPKLPDLLRKPEKQRILLCIVLAVVLAAVGVLLHAGSGSSTDLNALNAQATELKNAQAQLDTLETRYQKRVTQLEEAQANLAAAPEDEKLLSKLERAQGEYDKALKNRDQQQAKVDALPTMAELNEQITDLKTSSAGRALAANLLLTAAFVLGAFAMAGAVRQADVPVLVCMAGLAVAGCLIALGVRQNDLSPVLQADETAPGTTLIAIGLSCLTLMHAGYWITLSRSRLNVKTILGAALVLGGGALCVAGFLDNNAADAASRYSNSMSPGFPRIFVGAVLAILGTLILALPLTRIRYDLRKNPLLVLMVLPSIVYFLITSYLPMVGVYFAFTSYQFTTDFFSTLFGSKFVGLSNFEYLFSSGLAWRMTANTLIYNTIFIAGGTVLKVIIAIMFSEIAGKYYKKCVQTVTFLPHFISMVMVGTFAYNLLNYNSGVINSLLTALGFDRLDFYSMPNAWYVILPLVDFWKGVGYGSVMYLAAIMGIDTSIYEAAAIDGANVFQRIFKVTIPMIMPTTIILFLLSVGGIFKGNFDMFYNLVGNNGLLYNYTDVIDTLTFRALITNNDFGMSAAIGLFQSVLCFITVVLVNKLVGHYDRDYTLF